MQKITVNTGAKYDIIIDNNQLAQSGGLIRAVSVARKAVIVTDDIVEKLYAKTVEESLRAAGFETGVFVFPNGESSKSHKTLIELYAFLAEKNITRTDIVVALGGGVVGDLTGFAAASFLRGIDFVQIPTTLLAQVDSSVGGKTAVNIPAGKNLVGAFHQPKLVICDTDALKTLSAEIFADGMGEVVKYGMIRSQKLFELLENGTDPDIMTDIITECVKIKRDVVETDEFDTGERMLLNFGHTMAHGIEKYNNFGGISHGKAVAIGMALISEVAERHGLVSGGVTARLINCLKANGLPYETDIPLGTLFEYSLGDKKRSSDSISIILCPQIGNGQIKKMKTDEFRTFLLD